MQMSDHEILYHYNHAVDQAAQVKILAELNAVDVPTMRNKLLDLGAQNVTPVEKLPRRMGGVRFDENRAEELYNDGLCDHDIAECLGIGKSTVADWRRRNGLACHRAPPGYIKGKKRSQIQESEEVPPEPTEPPEPVTAEQPPAEEVPPEKPPRMSVEGLLRVTEQMREAFPQAEITADGRYVRDILVSVFYNSDGMADSAVMNLILED